MKNAITNLKEFFTSRTNILKSLVIYGAIIFSILTSNNYNMNPFIGLSMIYFANTSFIGLAINIIIIISCGFINSLYYGLELAIISFMFLALLSLPKFKNNSVLNSLPIIIFYSLIVPLFLINNFNQLNLIRSIFSFIFTLSGYYYLTNKDDDSELHKINNNFILSFLPSLFYSFDYLLLPSIILSFLYTLIKNKNIIERIAFISSSFLVSYFYLLIPTKTLLMLYPAFFITSFFKNSYLSTTLYIIAIEVLNIIYNPTKFFSDENFYYPLISFALAMILINPLSETIKENKIDKRQTKINNIHEYLNLIMDNSIDPYLDKKSLRENLKIKPCHKCSHVEDCIHLNRFVDNLPNKLYKPYKDDALKNCPNGGKLVYRYKVLKEMVAYEQKQHGIKQEQYSALKSIVAPIKSLCYQEDDSVSSVTINNSLNKNIISLVSDDSIKTYEKLSLNELETTSKILHKNIDDNPKFHLLDHTYTYEIKNNNKNRLDIRMFKKNFSASSGDIINHYKTDNYEELVLIDAMGHNQSSLRHGRIAERLLTLSRSNDTKIEARLEEINTILSYQGSGENFLAIDLLSITNECLKLYKFGSPNSFVVRGNEVLELINNNPPLGIVSELDYTPIEIAINKGDKLIILSDGITIDKNTIHELNLENRLTPENIFNDAIKNEDDVSLLVIEFLETFNKEPINNI